MQKKKKKRKNVCGLKFGAHGPKSGPKLVFLFFQVWFISFPKNIIG